jgi:hypothetical protein
MALTASSAATAVKPYRRCLLIVAFLVLLFSDRKTTAKKTISMTKYEIMMQ